MGEVWATAVRMLTFAPMIDSELSRLLLTWYGVPHQEERHLFGYVSLLALLRGGTPQVPLITGSGSSLAGPRAIANRYDAVCAARRRLLPAQQPLATQVEADWNRYNGLLATETAVFAYFHLLPHPDIMMAPLSEGLSPGESKALRDWAYAPMRQLISLLLRLSPARATDAQIRIRSAFDHVDGVLADGRRYIAGTDLTLGDFALVSALAPLLQPPGYGAPVPPPEVLPNAMASVVAELQARPTAAFVRRIYSEHPPLR